VFVYDVLLIVMLINWTVL